jgi:pyridoxine 5-phosphate synthase
MAVTILLNFEWPPPLKCKDRPAPQTPRHLHRPEKREERTTEGGLEVAREETIWPISSPSRDAGCRVSIFIADKRHRSRPSHWRAIIELHTGAYCDAHAEAHERRDTELERCDMAGLCAIARTEVHAGHGLT